MFFVLFSFCSIRLALLMIIFVRVEFPSQWLYWRYGEGRMISIAYAVEISLCDLQIGIQCKSPKSESTLRLRPSRSTNINFFYFRDRSHLAWGRRRGAGVRPNQIYHYQLLLKKGPEGQIGQPIRRQLDNRPLLGTRLNDPN